MEKTYPSGLIWFRRDLRAYDNAALYHALKSCDRVYCAFVFDTDILDGLPRRDRRLEFIRESLLQLDADLRRLTGDEGGGLIVLHGPAREVLPRLAHALDTGQHSESGFDHSAPGNVGTERDDACGVPARACVTVV